MSKVFISPFKLDEIIVYEASLRVNPKGPSGKLRFNITLDAPKPKISHSDEKKTYSSFMLLKVSVSIVDADENGSERMSATVRMGARTSVPDGVGDEKEALRYLRINGVSMMYSHARSCVAMLTGMSPMREFTLPAIDPTAYIDNIEEHEADAACSDEENEAETSDSEMQDTQES